MINYYTLPDDYLYIKNTNNTSVNAGARIKLIANIGNIAMHYVNNGGFYLNTTATSVSSAAEDAISEGCIVLASAGNHNQKLSDKTDVDFNNIYYTVQNKNL